MMRLRTILAAVSCVFIASPVMAQQPAAASPPVMKGAPRVVVTDLKGQEATGRLIAWTGSSIVVRSNGIDRTYASGEAVRVDLRDDSLKNGALIGAAFGSLTGFLAECSGASSSCAGERIGFTALSMGLWAAVGAAIDHLIPGRSPLWVAGSTPNSARGLALDLSATERRASIRWHIAFANP